MREKIKMAKHFNTFEELSLSRKKWLESSQDNGFDKGLLKLLTELYPDRVIEPIYAREILLGGGNIHCITQQVPLGEKK